MARHEFGVMESTPALADLYVTYEPERYRCLTVDDRYLEPLLPKLADMPTCFHGLGRPARGLAYAGITLIPPTSLPQLERVLAAEKDDAYRELLRLVRTAEAQGRYVIHFGI